MARVSRRPDPSPAPLKWVWYALSVLVPFGGILIAIFLYDQEDREVRKAGRNCLVVGFLLWVALPLMALLFLALAGLFILLGLSSQVLSHFG